MALKFLDSLAAPVLDNGGAIFNVRHPDFGAIGNGSADDASAVQAALSAAGSVGGVVHVPDGTYLADGLVTTGPTRIVGPGTLKLRPNAASDRILEVVHDDCAVEGVALDGNAAAHTSYAGRGEGLKISGARCRVRGVRVNHTPVTSFAAALYVVGDDAVVEGFASEGSGYVAVRANGNRGQYRGLTLTNWTKKGILIDAAVDRCDIDGAYVASTTTGSGVECLLVDPGTNGQMGSLYLRGLRCEGPDGVADANNVAKLVLVERAYLTGCEFLHTNPLLASLRLQEGVGRLYIQRSTFARNINFDDEGEAVVLEDCIVGLGTAGSGSQALEQCKARSLAVRRTRFYGYTGAAMRIEAGSTFHPRVTVDEVELEAAAGSTTAKMFSLAYTPNPGEIKVGGYRVVVGSSDGVNNLTALTSVDALIQQGSFREFSREFRATAVPTAGTWKQGDIVWNISPAAGGAPGWVCVTAGTPGSWKAMAALAA